MSCYFVYGTLGAGKGIFLARKMKEYLARGSRVATNVDLFPENLSPNTEASISRVPSIFRLEDLEQLGRGCPEEEKTQLGGLFLDEGAMWLNSRDWNAKGRKQLIDKLIMIRKLGWDIFIAVQDPESTDKQALGALGENFICCSRLDHFRIPIISDLVDFYHLVKTKGREQRKNILPHINRAQWRRGKSKQGNPSYFKETYKPKDYFGTYDTNQIFEVDSDYIDGRLIDMRAPFSYVPGKTLKTWYSKDSVVEPKKKKTKFPWGSLSLCILFGGLSAFAYSMTVSGSDSKTVAPVPEHVEQNRVSDSQQVAPVIPDYLDGVYISGYVMSRKDGVVNYDYAIHDKSHRSFDVFHYGLTVTPAAPCVAWLTTYDDVTIKITCKIAPPSAKPEMGGSVLDDFSLSSVASSTIEAM